jgi:isopropylmalate/homocitrate/citramalate synthase
MNRDEIRQVKDLGVTWVGLFAGINDRSLKRYGLSKQAVYEKARAAVAFAKELGLRVRFTCEDASRTEFGDLVEFYEHLASLGVDRMSYADTVGIVRPEDIEKIHCRINDRVPFGSLHFHFHNDFGFAGENAVKAAECGARCIDASILGIGERAGLASLERVLAFLDGKNGKEDKIAHLREAAELVRSCINQEHYQNRRFAHKSGIHINGTIKDPANYEPMEPERAGSKRILVLSKLIGRSGLAMLLTRHGFRHVEQDLASLLEDIKSEDMLELAGPEEICGYFMERGLERQVV